MKTDPKPAYWAVIPAQVRYDDRLPPNAKLLYGEISALCDKRGYCFAENRYFAELYGLSLETVRRLIASLSDGGYINVEVVRNRRTKAVEERRIYAGLQEGVDPPTKNVGTSPQKSADRPHKNEVANKVYQSESIITPKAPKGGRRDVSKPKWRPEDFETFWDYYRTYARGDDRAGAVREWDRLKPDDDLLHVMGQALAAHVRSDDWRRGYIPHARTWLHNRRWEDTGRKAAPPAGASSSVGGGEECMVGSDLPQW